jgi:hypothetical protein
MAAGSCSRLTAALSMGAAADPVAVVRACYAECGGELPTQHRAAVYACLLGVRLDDSSGSGPASHLTDSIETCELNLSNQRVVRVDAQRTRQELAEFRSDAAMERVAKILTFFCKCHHTPYRQGLNEVLAPLMVLSGEAGSLPPGVVYSLLQRMIVLFLPAAYGADDDFMGLQCSLQFLRLLLLYHDPELAKLLEQHSVTPELFATPWLITLMARGVPIDVVYVLWDTLVLHSVAFRPPEGTALHAGVSVGPGLLHFLVLALLIRNREKLISGVAADSTLGISPAAELPMIAARLTITTVADARATIELGCALAGNTPDSVRSALLEAAYSATSPPPALLTALECTPCVLISADEALRKAVDSRTLLAEGTTSASGKAHQLLVVDCRGVVEYGNSHIHGSFHLDPSALMDPSIFAAVAESFGGMKDLHIVVVGEGDITLPSTSAPEVCLPNVAQLVVLYLLNRSFSHVCCVRGGYKSVVSALREHPELETKMDLLESPFSAPSDAPLYDDGSDSDTELPPKAATEGSEADPLQGGGLLQRLQRRLSAPPKSPQKTVVDMERAAENLGMRKEQLHAPSGQDRFRSLQRWFAGRADGPSGEMISPPSTPALSQRSTSTGSASATPQAMTLPPPAAGASGGVLSGLTLARDKVRAVNGDGLGRDVDRDLVLWDEQLDTEVQRLRPASSSSSPGWSGRLRTVISSAAQVVGSSISATESVVRSRRPEALSAADASVELETLETRLALVHEGQAAAEETRQFPPSFFGLTVQSDEMAEDAVVCESGCVLSAIPGMESTIHVIGCKRVYPDKTVAERVVVVTPHWLCVLSVLPGHLEDAAEGESTVVQWAKRAWANGRASLPPPMLVIDQISPAKALVKLGGKKTVPTLAIIDLREPGRSSSGGEKSQRIVFLCDFMPRLVAAIRGQIR